MSGIPDDDVDALRRMLPVPGERDFPPGRRHQHEEHLMTSWLHQSARPAGPRRVAVRVAAPALVATALAGAFFAFQPSGHAGDSAPRAASHGVSAVAPATTPPAPVTPLTRISTAAYTLEHRSDDTVEITVHSGATDVIVAAQLQKQLAAMGVHARVSKGVTHTYPAIFNLAPREKNGDFVATLPHRLLGRYPETILFEFPSGRPTLYVTVVGR